MSNVQYIEGMDGVINKGGLVDEESSRDTIEDQAQEESKRKQNHQSLEKHIDKARHVPIKDEAHEDPIGESTDASISPRHECEGLVSFGSPRNFEFVFLIMISRGIILKKSL